MTSTEFGSYTLALLVLLATAHLLGLLFTRLRQPRVIGEILAGILLGQSVLGRQFPSVSRAIFATGLTTSTSLKYQAVIGFLYNLGLLLLMFASGAETRGLFRREDRREVGWLGSVGTLLPFAIAVAFVPLLPTGSMMGSAQQTTPLLLVIGIAFAVTSIPVISRIFHDLGILHTRFARLILGVAVLEDVMLWGVLAIATALAASGVLPERKIAIHVISAVVFFGLGLTVLPKLLRRVNRAPGNVFVRASPVAYVTTVLLAYSAAAAALDVSLVFAAFLAGYALVGDVDLVPATAALNKVSFAIFIPIYFTVVGYQLDLTRSLSWTMVWTFIGSACAVKLLSAGVGARIAGFSWRDAVNLAIALNARGGPGIVLASVAYDAGIINATFYTTLVLLAIVTSQLAGAWLDYLVRRGLPLLSTDRDGSISVSVTTPIGYRAP